MVIEKPRKEDFVEINEIAKEIHEQHIIYRPDIFKRVESPILQEDYIALIDNNEIYISKENDVITGYVIMKIKEQNAHEYFNHKVLLIEVIVIKKEYQNKGIGMQLMEYVMEIAKNKNCTDIELTVNPENINAIKFYEKIGMKVKNIKYSMKI